MKKHKYKRFYLGPMMRVYYILDGKKPIRCNDFIRWAWYCRPNRQVANRKVNGVRVSTVFLGINHEFREDKRPILFETMIWIDGKPGNFQQRYSTWKEAEDGHYETIKLCRDPEFIYDTFEVDE